MYRIDSSAVAIFADRTGQLIRDIVRLHSSVQLVLEEVSGGTGQYTHHSLGDPWSEFGGPNDRATCLAVSDAGYAAVIFGLVFSY
jgi:hypothetical protein